MNFGGGRSDIKISEKLKKIGYMRPHRTWFSKLYWLINRWDFILAGHWDRLSAVVVAIQFKVKSRDIFGYKKGSSLEPIGTPSHMGYTRRIGVQGCQPRPLLRGRRYLADLTWNPGLCACKILCGWWGQQGDARGALPLVRVVGRCRLLRVKPATKLHSSHGIASELS